MILNVEFEAEENLVKITIHLVYELNFLFNQIAQTFLPLSANASSHFSRAYFLRFANELQIPLKFLSHFYSILVNSNVNLNQFPASIAWMTSVFWIESSQRQIGHLENE